MAAFARRPRSIPARRARARAARQRLVSAAQIRAAQSPHAAAVGGAVVADGRDRQRAWPSTCRDEHSAATARAHRVVRGCHGAARCYRPHASTRCRRLSRVSAGALADVAAHRRKSARNPAPGGKRDRRAIRNSRMPIALLARRERAVPGHRYTRPNALALRRGRGAPGTRARTPTIRARTRRWAASPRIAASGWRPRRISRRAFELDDQTGRVHARHAQTVLHVDGPLR